MSAKSFRLIILVSAGLLTLCAQSAVGGGSIYSRFGIGDLMYFGGSRTDAMGITGIGLIGDGFINRLNPAGLAKIAHTRLSGSYEYSNISSSDQTGSGRFSRGDFKALALAIPISTTDGLVMQMETSPYSSVQYSTESSDEELTQKFFGTGGISTLGIGSSYSPWKRFYVGAKFIYLFGRIRQIDQYTFLDETFTNGEIHRSQYYSGFNFTIGATLDSLGSLLNSPSLQPLTLGIIMSAPARLSVKEEKLLVSNQVTDTVSTSTGSVQVPLAVGLGFSYFFSNRYMLAGDVFHQQWQNAEFFGKPSVDLRNSTRIGVGFEALPNRDGESYWERVAYRAGISYHSTYYNVKNQPINEWYASGGFGLPIGSDARLNIGLHAGVRGSSSSGLQRDTIFRLSVSLSASETWFLKFEED